jgi:hypothetical protein
LKKLVREHKNLRTLEKLHHQARGSSQWRKWDRVLCKAMEVESASSYQYAVQAMDRLVTLRGLDGVDSGFLIRIVRFCVQEANLDCSAGVYSQNFFSFFFPPAREFISD